MTDEPSKKATLFVGSSTEGLEWARALQEALSYDCDPQVWTDGIFQEGGTALASLRAATENFDFAAFVFTPDDRVVRRGEEGMAPRDNVVLELGMFVAALGPERVFVFRPREEVLVTPSDWWGILDCLFSVTGTNPTAAMSTAAKQLRKRIADLGLRQTAKESTAAGPVDHASELTNDLNAIKKAAASQGWVLQIWDSTMFRLHAPDGARHPFTLTDDALQDRERLRTEYVPQLVDKGLRVSLRVQAPVGADLRTWRPAVSPKPTKAKKRQRKPSSDTRAKPRGSTTSQKQAQHGGGAGSPRS